MRARDIATKKRHSSSVVMRALRLIGGRKLAGPGNDAAPVAGSADRVELGKLATVRPGTCTASNSRPLLPWTVISRTASMMQRGGRDLAQVALLGEQDELADAVQRPLDRQAERRPALARARN